MYRYLEGELIIDGLQKELSDCEFVISQEMERIDIAKVEAEKRIDYPCTKVHEDSSEIHAPESAVLSLQTLHSILHKLTVYMKIVPAFDGIVDVCE